MGPGTPLEDGSIAYYNADGTLAQIVPPNGGAAYLPDSSIVSNFLSTVAGSLSRVIAQDFGAKPAAPAAAAPAAASVSGIPPLLLYGGLALLAYKLFA